MITGQILFLIFTGVWLVFELYLHLFYNRKVTSSNKEKITKYIMLAFFVAGTLGGRKLPPNFHDNFLKPFTFHRYLCLPFLAAAIVIRLGSVLQLGKSFSVNLGVQPGQELITTSFYKYIRHPGYLSLFLGFCGIGIAFNHIFATPICIILSFTGIYIRVREEENILLNHFGALYREYKKRTKMLIPFVV